MGLSERATRHGVVNGSLTTAGLVRHARVVAGSDVLKALATIGGRRDELDRAEWLLVAAARRDGATWAEVAKTLGLRSRQAAEQRWLRLQGAVGGSGAAKASTRLREPSQVRAFRDPDPAPERDDVVRLRRSVALLYDLLVQLPAGPGADPALRLARETLAVGGPAPAGALHDLARRAVDDLRGTPTATQGPEIVRAASRVRDALDVRSTFILS